MHTFRNNNGPVSVSCGSSADGKKSELDRIYSFGNGKCITVIRCFALWKKRNGSDGLVILEQRFPEGFCVVGMVYRGVCCLCPTVGVLWWLLHVASR